MMAKGHVFFLVPEYRREMKGVNLRITSQEVNTGNLEKELDALEMTFEVVDGKLPGGQSFWVPDRESQGKCLVMEAGAWITKDKVWAPKGDTSAKPKYTLFFFKPWYNEREGIWMGPACVDINEGLAKGLTTHCGVHKDITEIEGGPEAIVSFVFRGIKEGEDDGGGSSGEEKAT